MSERHHGTEVMDDLGARGEGLIRSLHELRHVNRLLGGHRAIAHVLHAYLLRRAPGPVRILDLGSGITDIPARLVGWGLRRGIRIDVTAVEGNASVALEARRWLVEALSAPIRKRIRIVEADVWKLPPDVGRHDVVMASLFLHHMREERAVALLRLMHEHATDGLVVNDLHRHPLAYVGISVASRVMNASDVFRHDGPLSVRRGFTRGELMHLAAAADLRHARIRWHWAFRWTLSTLG